MKLIDSAQMKEFDRRTIAECGVPGETLMGRAGLGVARAVENLAGTSGYGRAPVCLFAGRGNNGGDAFVAARHLHEWGVDVCVWMTGEKKAVRGDALVHLNRLISAGPTVGELLEPADCDDLALSGCDCGIVVDGVLGTGLTGPARGVAAGAIRCINTFGADRPVVAIDIPSGLNADTGEAPGEAVRADLTVTLGFPKIGLAAPEALDYVGTVDVVDIGIPEFLSARVVSEMELITADDLRAVCPRRRRDTHKGSFGHVLLIGGSPGFSGAVAMAADAALRSGVGLVSVLAPRGIVPVVAGIVPEAMVHGADETPEGTLSASCLDEWKARLDGFDAVLAGPGMTTHEHSRRLVSELLSTAGAPLVLDADALNVFAGEATLLGQTARRLAVTPHPGEAGRLLGCTAADVQRDRPHHVRLLSEKTGGVVVLKGGGTLVTAPERPVGINLTGNPGMATGGTGDVLGGLLAGLLAQSVEPYDAACAAVYLHGVAGDEAAWHGSQAGLTAGDLIETLPLAFRRIAAR